MEQTQKSPVMRHIRKVAVLGSGIMGSRIACHFANVGVEVLLLDIVPRELNDLEKAKNLTLEHPAVRNRIVNEAFANTLKNKPASLYSDKSADKITLGNFDDNMKDIASADWVIEVVVERLDIKKQVFEKVEKFRKKGSLITSNTSGIPINLMTEGRSEDFVQNFCGTHFFNPPRYLKLLEIIPTPQTSPEVVDFLMHYGDLYLGKTMVLCKDTPAFIANRVGVYAIMDALHVVEGMNLKVEEIDKLTGPIIGRAKSATFRTLDVVGLDTVIHVANGITQSCAHDESLEAFKMPKIVSALAEKKWLGDKTGQGFYKMVRGENGSKDIMSLDFNTLEYVAQIKPKFAALDAVKNIERLADRFPVLFAAQDKAGEFYRKTFAGLFAYATNRIPEIANDLYSVDDAICAGFGWEMGPFATWDAIGLETGLKIIADGGKKAAAWVEEMKAAGHTSFYKVENGVKKYYDIPSKSYKNVAGSAGIIILDNIRKTNVVWGNSGSTIFDLGDGVLGLEFHTKMNSMGAEVIAGINMAVEMAEKSYRGLVIGGDGENFSAGANIGMIFMAAAQQEFEEVNMMVAQFQNTMMRVRYSSIPVVTAPFGLALGGGCEINLHADHVQAHAETYMGLVEVGVGLIPGGGGTKEMALRVADAFREGDPELNILQSAFMNIATAKVGTSAREAFDLNYLRNGKDSITLNRSRLLADAKAKVLELADAGYTQPKQRTNIKVQGKSGMALFSAGITGMKLGKYISEHDQKIANKLAYVICGGDLSYPQEVSEQYLLNLEREAFLSLCGEQKTLERIQSILTTGKPLRN